MTTFSRSQHQHPLLIAEIADKVLGYLAASANNTYAGDNVNDLVLDLSSCFDVCLLWRSLVPPHVIRLRTRPNRPPIVIKGSLTETEDPSGRGPAYLASIRKHPCFKTTKFSFRNVDLNSTRVRELVRLNGQEVEELELWYDSHRPGPASRKCPLIKKDPLTVLTLEDLLRKELPNLETLIIKQLPPTIVDTHLFRILSLHLGTGIAGSSGRSHRRIELPVSAKLSKLRTIRLAANFDCRLVSPGPHESNERKPPWPFLVGLLAAAPYLEALELIDGGPHPSADYAAGRAVKALGERRHCTNITTLKLTNVDQDGMLDLLEWVFGVQEWSGTFRGPHLRHLSIPKSTLPPATPADGSWNLLRVFLESQSPTLEYLQFPLVGIQLRRLILPIMDKLVELRLYTDDKPKDPVSLAARGRRGGHLNYTTQFPSLRVLGLKGLLQNYIVNEIYPDPLFKGFRSCDSVDTLQEIPHGVDQTFMARIARLFPNLSIIRTTIPYAHERLLVSVWEFCPNITQLFLTLDDASNQGHLLIDRSLDSIFSGIHEFECRRLFKLPAEERRTARPTCLRDPSLRALKKLKRLVIDGPARTLGGRPESGPGWFVTRSPDRLSDVFGYSTLASVVAQSLELEFVQISHGLAEMSSNCLDHICGQSGNKMKREICRGVGVGPNFVRLIKRGAGLEGLGPVPRDWYGV